MSNAAKSEPKDESVVAQLRRAARLLRAQAEELDRAAREYEERVGRVQGARGVNGHAD